MNIATLLFLTATGTLALMGFVLLLEGVLLAKRKLAKSRSSLSRAALASLVWNKQVLR